MAHIRVCRDCEQPATLNRRQFVQAAGAAAAAASMAHLGVPLLGAEAPAPESEQLVRKLYESLTPEQKSKLCFPWDHTDDRGLLRTHVSNNWSIIPAPDNHPRNEPHPFAVGGDYFSADQRDLIEALFFGLYHPDWKPSLKKQLQDDAGGYGRQQTIAFFGEPGKGKWEWVMTGRHLTIRCDGDSSEHVAFGGPIFYGHAAQAFDEPADHAGNVYWHQALKANALYEMLDGQQRARALVEDAPYETEVAFRGDAGGLAGIPIAELTSDQKAHAQEVLKTLLEPYRTASRDEALKCLEVQGGLDKCSLAFFREDDIGEDGVWDIWRIEGPSFVWHYRGAPHVHVWVNIADDSSPVLNAAG
jgi:hypothetical protein